VVRQHPRGRRSGRQASDYNKFTFSVPSDSRLPDGGGYTFTAFDLRTGVPPQDLFVTLAENVGDVSEHFDGVNVTVNARMTNGVRVQGGLGTGRQITDDCAAVAQAPELLHTFFGTPSRFFAFAARPLERCQQNNGWRTRYQGLATYTIPKVDVQLSGTFQNQPGAQLAANANVCASFLIPGSARSATRRSVPDSRASRRSARSTSCRRARCSSNA
jgi:hypothetical protein